MPDNFNGQDDAMLQVACLVKNMQDVDPPDSILPSVMGCIRPMRRPWWYRFYKWVASPRSITFTPLHAAPLCAVLIVGMTLLGLHAFNRYYTAVVQPGASNRIPVRLSLHLPEARSVSVIGTFNQWRPHGYNMQFDGKEAVWTLTIQVPEGRYEYGFLVDGEEVIPDPRSGLYEDDGFGSQNSILIVGNTYDQAA